MTNMKTFIYKNIDDEEKVQAMCDYDEGIIYLKITNIFNGLITSHNLFDLIYHFNKPTNTKPTPPPCSTK